MANCFWCNNDMNTGISCTADALHTKGRRVELAPYGGEPGVRRRKSRCGGCGVTPGGFHHPGCDLQRCPVCRGQLLSCGCSFDEHGGHGDHDCHEDGDDEE